MARTFHEQLEEAYDVYKTGVRAKSIKTIPQEWYDFLETLKKDIVDQVLKRGAWNIRYPASNIPELFEPEEKDDFIRFIITGLDLPQDEYLVAAQVTDAEFTGTAVAVNHP